jgi:hypothetical protein
MTENPMDLLALHAVRILGFADASSIARRFDLDPPNVEEFLLDAEARGWTAYTSFDGTEGWSLTERGRAENERQLAAELTRTGGAADVRAAYDEFLPLNATVLRAGTDWQLKPTREDRLAPNDHTDPRWDAAVLRALDNVAQALPQLIERLTRSLQRFRGYDARFTTALARARTGEPSWIDHTDIDSCHRVWFELHEDLIATLGIDRRTTT